MDLTPVEQVAPSGNADTSSSDSAQVAAPTQTTLTKTAFDAVPSLADAIKARMSGAGSSVTHPAEPNPSAAPEQPATDASPNTSSGQTGAENTGASTDGVTTAATPSDTPSEPVVADQPKKLSRSARRAAREEARQAAATTGTPLPDEEEDDDDFLVSEVQRAVGPLAAKVQELASTITSVTNPGPVPPDVAKLNESYVEKFGDDAVFSELADIKVKNSRVLSLSEDEQLATWAENRLVRDLQTAKIQRDVSAVLLGVAVQRGVDAEAITRAPNLAAACEAIWSAGHSAGQSATTAQLSTTQQAAISQASAKQAELTAQLTALNSTNEELKRSNQALSEELEALQQRAPAFARQAISGGLASLTNNTGVAPLDPSRQSGREMLLTAARNMARQSQSGTGPAVRNR